MSMVHVSQNSLVIRLPLTSWMLARATKYMGLSWRRCSRLTWQTPDGDRGTAWHVGPVVVARMEFQSVYGLEAYS